MASFSTVLPVLSQRTSLANSSYSLKSTLPLLAAVALVVMIAQAILPIFAHSIQKNCGALKDRVWAYLTDTQFRACFNQLNQKLQQISQEKATLEEELRNIQQTHITETSTLTEQLQAANIAIQQSSQEKATLEEEVRQLEVQIGQLQEDVSKTERSLHALTELMQAQQLTASLGEQSLRYPIKSEYQPQPVRDHDEDDAQILNGLNETHQSLETVTNHTSRLLDELQDMTNRYNELQERIEIADRRIIFLQKSLRTSRQKHRHYMALKAAHRALQQRLNNISAVPAVPASEGIAPTIFEKQEIASIRPVASAALTVPVMQAADKNLPWFAYANFRDHISRFLIAYISPASRDTGNTFLSIVTNSKANWNDVISAARREVWDNPDSPEARSCAFRLYTSPLLSYGTSILGDAVPPSQPTQLLSHEIENDRLSIDLLPKHSYLRVEANKLGSKVNLFDPIAQSNLPFLVGERNIAGQKVKLIRHSSPTCEVHNVSITPEYLAFIEYHQEKQEKILYNSLLSINTDDELPRLEELYKLPQEYPETFFLVKMPMDSKELMVGESSPIKLLVDFNLFYDSVLHKIGNGVTVAQGNHGIHPKVNECFLFSSNLFSVVQLFLKERFITQTLREFMGANRERLTPAVITTLLCILLKDYIIKNSKIDTYNNTCKDGIDRGAVHLTADLIWHSLMSRSFDNMNMRHNIRLALHWPAYMAKTQPVLSDRIKVLLQLVEWIEAVGEEPLWTQLCQPWNCVLTRKHSWDTTPWEPVAFHMLSESDPQPSLHSDALQYNTLIVSKRLSFSIDISTPKQIQEIKKQLNRDWGRASIFTQGQEYEVTGRESMRDESSHQAADRQARSPDLFFEQFEKLLQEEEFIHGRYQDKREDRALWLATCISQTSLAEVYKQLTPLPLATLTLHRWDNTSIEFDRNKKKWCVTHSNIVFEQKEAPDSTVNNNNTGPAYVYVNVYFELNVPSGSVEANNNPSPPSVVHWFDMKIVPKNSTNIIHPALSSDSRALHIGAGTDFEMLEMEP